MARTSTSVDSRLSFATASQADFRTVARGFSPGARGVSCLWFGPLSALPGISPRGGENAGFAET